MIVYTTIGAMIEDRRPGQIVGRICLAIGVFLVVSGLLVLAATTLDSLPGRLPPLGASLAVISSAIFTLVFLLGGPLLISRFPAGRERGRSASSGDGLLVIAGAIVLTGALFRMPTRYDDPVFTVAVSAYGLAYILACIGLIRRYVRGSSVVRAQIRWFAAAIGTFIVLFTLTLLIDDDRLWRAGMLALLLPPLAIGVAILRYHLYEIDRLISRGLSWAVLSGLLVAVYAGAVILLQSVLAGVTQGEPWRSPAPRSWPPRCFSRSGGGSRRRSTTGSTGPATTPSERPRTSRSGFATKWISSR